ncbi:UNVERIFIED_CONTAM: hypothetical protein RMT77_017003 [Armadillidium vulgare]
MVCNLSNYEIDSSTVNSIKTGAIEILKHIKPDWNEDKLNFKIYTEGISNKLIGIWYENFNDQVLVRIYGEKTELFIDRNAEKNNIKLLHDKKCGPELFAVFKNGLSYSFVPGTPLDAKSVLNEEIWTAVAKHMTELHKIEVKMSEPLLFPKIRTFIDLLPSEFDEEKNRRIAPHGLSKLYFENEVNELEPILTSLGCPLAFCHNDILLSNIIWNREEKSVNFIDFEYAASNYQAYDIANHFNELPGVDIDLDYDNLFPSVEFQRIWIRKYLSYFKKISLTDIPEDEIEKWRKWVCKFTLASHLLWGAWSLLQSCHSTIDFDFTAYSLTRILEYRKRKKMYLEL